MFSRKSFTGFTPEIRRSIWRPPVTGWKLFDYCWPPEPTRTRKRIIVKEGAGCIRCRNTGYFGRTGIFEILPIDNAIRDLVDRSEDFLKIKDMAIKRGMRTLRQSALRKLAEGITTFEEVVRVTGI